MKSLLTSNEFRTAIYDILKAKPKYLYLASYGIKINSEFFKKLIKNVPKNTKLIIGNNNPDFDWIKDFMESNGLQTRLSNDFHGKLVVSDKGVIIGGRNLTDSDWEDYSFFSDRKKTIELCKKAFENSWRKLK